MTFRSRSRRVWILLNGLLWGMTAAAVVMTGLWTGGSVQATHQDTSLSVVWQDGSQAGDTLFQVENTILPPRDRVDLAIRLRGVTDVPEPPSEAPPEVAIGEIVSFWVDNLDEDYSFQVDAELVYKTDHIYMFVELGQTVDLAAIQRSADTFENTIRPRVHEVFGSEWFPGVDGDPHLTILHVTRLGGWVAAYYGSSSQYPDEVVPNSNEREMFFVNLDTMAGRIGQDAYLGVLAHEFQHMVHWYVDQNEDTWLNEGLSELSSMLAGYGASGFAYDYLREPTIQLNTWPEDNDRGRHYGMSFLFAAYFYERYGEAATTTLVKDPANGMESIANTLDAIAAADPATGEPVVAEDVFADWVVANLLMDSAAGDGRFAYHSPDMATLPTASITGQAVATGAPIQTETRQWGATYLEIPGGAQPRTFRLKFDGNETVGLVPANAHSGQFAWWSNRGDESDSRLTQAFDLTGVSSATLDFWTWYFIEDLWDYAYVMVSTDGGATWTPLETAHTTTDDPHQNAYGPGYTGQSGDWVRESVDLTPYAGQEILLRFEYITDDAVTQPGILIDDISIPEIGYTSDFENDNGGWLSEGWLRMDNKLPQRFLVQVVQIPLTAPGDGEAWPVTRLLGMADTPHGEWDITVGGDRGNAVLVISGLAPVTTEPAAFTYSLTLVK
ncbi:MAG: immune inhibitor A [Anaerolineae bacterium]|nr:immune inhibitor A [Anaerolineae bacterium]